IDDALIKWGAPVGVKNRLEFYSRPVPEKDEELLQAPATPASPGAPSSDPAQAQFANEADFANALARSVANDLEPVRLQLDAILGIVDPELREIKLRKFLANLDQLKADMLADPSSAEQINKLLVAGFVRGAENRPNIK